MKAWCAVLAFVLGACPANGTRDPLVEHAAFGVFFGGQIQDRSELPFELDPIKQRCGMRVDFRAPLVRPAELAWEIARPVARGASTGADAAAEQVVELGEAQARVGQQRLDLPVLLRQGQVPGVWHVRLKVDGRPVIDRDVLVFDARERRERELDAGH